MGRFVFILGILMFVLTLGVIPASAGEGTGDGHSFAWFRDADGDGIPNGLDDDWLRPEDGSGYQVKNRFGLFGVGSFWGVRDGGQVFSSQNHYRKNKPDNPGDCLRIRLKLRDGSCN